MEMSLLLIRARQYMAQTLSEGGCDHDAGICQCADEALVQAIDDELYRQLGHGIVTAFFDADPSQTNTDKFKWAKDGAEVARKCIDRALGDADPAPF